jgi:hypothetical protein
MWSQAPRRSARIFIDIHFKTITFSQLHYPSPHVLFTGDVAMSATVSGFSSSTTLHGGHKGLIITHGSTSKLTITGTNLTNGKPVTVLLPPGSTNPTYQWDGRSADANASGTQCTSEVKQQKASPPRDIKNDKDDPATVSVTVDDSAPKNGNTYIGTP